LEDFCRLYPTFQLKDELLAEEGRDVHSASGISGAGTESPLIRGSRQRQQTGRNNRIGKWIRELEGISPGNKGFVTKLVLINGSVRET
jgi:hypothetical protein